MQAVSADLNHDKMKNNLLYVRTHCVPRSIRYPPQLLTRIKFTKIRTSTKLLLVYMRFRGNYLSR